MSVTYSQMVSVNSGGAGSIAGAFEDVGNNDLQIDQGVGAGLTDSPLGILFNGANLQSIVLVSSQNVTLKINSTGSPFATINLKANIPFHWSASASYFANPLNVNVTQVYATTTSACRLRGRVLTN